MCLWTSEFGSRESADVPESKRFAELEIELALSLHLNQSNFLQVRFSRLAQLSDHEAGIIRMVEARGRYTYRPDNRILSEGMEIRAPHVVMSGWAAKSRQLADGRRQIVGIVLPGDAIGLCSRARPLALTTVVAITTVKTVEAGELLTAWRDPTRTPNLAASLDTTAAEDEHYLFGHAMRLGRQTAYERIAHLFCELEYRLSSRGLSSGGSFNMPMTQETIADVAGLSVVHVNRTLQQMRREGRIELARSRLAILDLPGLQSTGEFVPPRVSLPAE